MSDISFIQRNLQGPPFNMKTLSVGTLGQMSGPELLQLLMDACIAVQPKLPRVVVAKDGAEAAAERVEFFLRMVKYQPGPQAHTSEAVLAGMVSCRAPVLLEILGWLTQNADLLPARAHVGWFLVDIPFPDELRLDPQVQHLTNDTRAAQGAFISLDRRLKEVEAGRRDPEALAEEMQRMQLDKTRLQERILKVRMRVEGQVPREDVGAMLRAAQSVREAREAAVKLRGQVSAEREKTEALRSRVEGARAQLLALKAATEAGSAQGLLDSQRARVEELRSQVQGRALETMNERAKRLDALRQALSLPVKDEGDLEQLVSTRRDLDAAVADLKQRISKRQGEIDAQPAFAALRAHAQMARVGAKKLEEKRQKLERIENRRRALRREVESRFGAEDESRSSPSRAEVSPAALEQKAVQVRELLGQYRGAKRLVENVEAEDMVLKRTVESLRALTEEMRAEVRRTEAEHGVEGYTDTQAGLEKISEQKAAVDEGKGAMLEEISKTVAAITSRVKEREAELVPRIQARKEAKQALLDLQARLDQSQSDVRRALAEASGGFVGLESEVAGMLAEAAKFEQQYHAAGALEPGVDAMVRLVDARTSTSSVELQALRDMFTERLERARDEKAQLEVRARNVDAQGESMAGQEDVIRGLRRLLEAKMVQHGAHAGSGSMARAEQFETARGNVMIMS